MWEAECGQGRSRAGQAGTGAGSSAQPGERQHFPEAGGGLRGHAWGSLAEPTGLPSAPRGRGRPAPAARMKRLCEESSSDTESDGTIDVGREEEYR